MDERCHNGYNSHVEDFREREYPTLKGEEAGKHFPSMVAKYHIRHDISRPCRYYVVREVHYRPLFHRYDSEPVRQPTLSLLSLTKHF
jgi:hypothetical protein